jgi:nucleolar protein 9
MEESKKKRGRRGGQGKEKQEKQKKQKVQELYFIDKEPVVPVQEEIEFSRSENYGSKNDVEVELDSDLRNYFLEIEKRLESLRKEEAFEQIEILIENSFEEIEKNMNSCINDYETSRIIEKLVISFTKKHFKKFYQKIKPNIKELFESQFGSHVIQTFIIGLYNSEDIELFAILLEITILLKDCYQIFLTNQHASHVFRTLLNLLSGNTLVKEEQIKSKKSKQYGKNHDMNHKVKTLNVPLEFTNTMHSIIDSISDHVLENLMNLVVHPVGNPCLQLLVCAKGDKDKNKIVKKIIKQFNDQNIVMLVKDQVGSHLMEKIILHADKKSFKKIYGVLKQDIASLCEHHVANFCVQSLIESCQDQEIFDELITIVEASCVGFICIL